MATTSRPPTNELGVTYESASLSPGAPWSAFVDTQEYVLDLKWPQSITVYDQMRTDSQLAALLWAMTAPIRRFKWMIDPNGADDAIVTGVAEDLNMDVVGEEPRPRGRSQHRFSHSDHLFHALLALPYGHMVFEQVGEVVDGLWRLRKLAPRLPWTISEINVAADGGLVSIKQYQQKSWTQQVEIPVDRLTWYAWEKEGANWPGRSIMRDCYKNWVVKDRLVRIDAINHERAGGVPWIEASPGATTAERQEMAKMAQQFKVGEEAGGAVPSGSSLNIARLGAGTDVVNSIRYHDEAMARRFLMMFIQLGQTETGSRALGREFVDYAFLAQKAVAQWYLEITNKYVIEDWVDWNYGEEEEQVPLLTYVIEEEDEYLPVRDLVELVKNGVISVDNDLEDYLRERFRLPRLQAQPENRQPAFVVPDTLPTDVTDAVEG